MEVCKKCSGYGKVIIGPDKEGGGKPEMGVCPACDGNRELSLLPECEVEIEMPPLTNQTVKISTKLSVKCPECESEHQYDIDDNKLQICDSCKKEFIWRIVTEVRTVEWS